VSSPHPHPPPAPAPTSDTSLSDEAACMRVFVAAAVGNKLLMLFFPFLRKWTYARMHEQVSSSSSSSSRRACCRVPAPGSWACCVSRWMVCGYAPAALSEFGRWQTAPRGPYAEQLVTPQQSQASLGAEAHTQVGRADRFWVRVTACCGVQIAGGQRHRPPAVGVNAPNLFVPFCMLWRADRGWSAVPPPCS
jgi:hypothetical protein